jgi:FkbH-like protein
MHGIELEVKAGDFNTYAQDILNPSSYLYTFEPDLAIVSLQECDIEDTLRQTFRERSLAHLHWEYRAIPTKAEEYINVAYAWARKIYAIAGKLHKVLALDLDGTVWDGVIGEGEIKPNISLQQEVLKLHERGVILALASKNNETDVLSVFDDLDMPLKLKHITTHRINWLDKASNLCEMAKELNVSVDSLVFLDNSRAERQAVRMQSPEVTVMPVVNYGAMDSYAKALRNSLYFESDSLTDEDVNRNQYYTDQHKRKEARRAMSLEDFYRYLEQEVEIRPVTVDSIPRVAQLTQKTNQFNLTTKRYTEREIIEMDTDEHWRIYTLRVKDKFGDNGITGVAILHFHDSGCEVDTFLLSCRIIGRTVETAFLRWLAIEAELYGALWFSGRYIPTKKNVLVKDFYQQHGFTRWLGGWMIHDDITQPEWITYA